MVLLSWLIFLISGCVGFINTKLNFFQTVNSLISVFFIPFVAAVLGAKINFISLNKALISAIIMGLSLNFLALLFRFSPNYDFPGMHLSGSILGGQASLLALLSVASYLILRKRLFLLTAFISSCLLILSYHRTGFIALIASILILNYEFFRAFFFLKLSRLILFMFSLVIFLLVIYLSLPSLIKIFFFDGNISIESINSSGRMVIWPMLILDILARDTLSLLIGTGFGSAESFLRFMMPSDSGVLLPHNEFLRLAYDYGLLGIFSFLFFYLVVFQQNIKAYSKYGYAIAIHFFLESFFSNSLNWTFSYIFVAVMYASSLKKLSMSDNKIH